MEIDHMRVIFSPQRGVCDDHLDSNYIYFQRFAHSLIKFLLFSFLFSCGSQFFCEQPQSFHSKFDWVQLQEVEKRCRFLFRNYGLGPMLA